MALEMSHILHSDSVISNIHLNWRWSVSGYGGDGYTGCGPHSWIVQSNSIVMFLPKSCVESRYRRWECQSRLIGWKLPLIFWWGCWAEGYVGWLQAVALVAYSVPEVHGANLASRQIPLDFAAFEGGLTLPIASNYRSKGCELLWSGWSSLFCGPAPGTGGHWTIRTLLSLAEHVSWPHDLYWGLTLMEHNWCSGVEMLTPASRRSTQMSIFVPR